MKLTVFSAAIAGLGLAFSAPAAAQVTLVDLIDIPAQVSTPSSTLDPTQFFTATSTSTTLTIAGYDVPASFALVNIMLASSSAPTTNVLGAHFTYTAAPCSPLAGEGNLGTHGTYDLSFRGGCVGGYDSFAQTFATSIGETYNLSYLFTLVTNGGRTGTAVPNGLRITAGDAALTAAVPEPATWAMMLLGFGAIGFQMRRKRGALQIA